MRKLFTIFLFCFFVSHLTLRPDLAGFDVSPLFAQQPTQEWVATFVRNPGGGESQGPFYALDKYGNSFVAGPNFINDTNNIVVVKYNSSGVQQWAVTYKYPGYGYVYPTSLSLDSVGNPVVASTYGATAFPPQNFLTVKFNGISGSVIWVKTFDGVNVGPGDIDMKIDKQDNVVLVSTLGGTGTDSTLCIKYNGSGDTLWTRTWRPQGSDRVFYGFTIDDSSNIVITGIAGTVVNSFSYDSVLTMKYSPGGVLRWERTLAYYASYAAQNQGQKVTTDQFGNIYVTGRTSASASNVGFLTMKYDLNGNLQWASRYYRMYENYVSAITVDRIHNCVFVTGQSQSINNQVFATSIKYNAINGDSIWVARDTGTFHNGSSSDIKTDSLGYIYITGYTSQVGAENVLNIKYSSQGSLVWNVTYNGSFNGVDVGTRVVLDNTDNIYICGVSQGGTQQFDLILIKYSQTSGIIRIDNSVPGRFYLSSNPNPFNPQTSVNFNIPYSGKVTINIYDILGRLVETLANERELKAGGYKLLLDGTNFASGVYFCRMNMKYEVNNVEQSYNNTIKLILSK